MAEQVTIVAPYDNSVTSVVLAESAAVWEARGWTVQQDASTPNTTAGVTSTSGGNVPPKAPAPGTTPAPS